jgi:VWFA-related protein
MNFLKLTVIILFLTFFTVQNGFAQDDPIKIETNLVNVGVVVKDRQGKYLKGLKKEDFQVFDNNEKQEIEIISGDDEPISIGIVYDLHPTTSQRTKVVLNSLRRFSKELQVKNDLFSIVFNDRGSLKTDFVPTIEQIDAFIYRNTPSQPNSLYDAVFAASGKIKETRNLKKMLLVISDGQDHSSHHSFSELSKLLKSFNVQIYSVILDNNSRWEYSDITFNRRRIRTETSFLDQANLKELSEKSGGNAENPFIESENILTNIFKQMIDEMRQQYSIGFYPKTSEGKRHKLKVTVNLVPKQRLTIIHRKDYLSQSK